MSYPPIEMQFKELLLDKLKVAAVEQISGQMLHDMRLDVTSDLMTNRLVARLSSYVLADKILDEETVELVGATTVHGKRLVPRSPWQAFKDRQNQVNWSVDTLTGIGQLARAFWLWVSPPKYWTVEFEEDVRLTKVVHAREYFTFPRNKIVYPPELGGSVRLQMLEQYEPWEGS